MELVTSTTYSNKQKIQIIALLLLLGFINYFYLCWNELPLVVSDSEMFCVDWKSGQCYPLSGNRIVDDHIKLSGSKQVN